LIRCKCKIRRLGQVRAPRYRSTGGPDHIDFLIDCKCKISDIHDGIYVACCNMALCHHSVMTKEVGQFSVGAEEQEPKSFVTPGPLLAPDVTGKKQVHTHTP